MHRVPVWKPKTLVCLIAAVQVKERESGRWRLRAASCERHNNLLERRPEGFPHVYQSLRRCASISQVPHLQFCPCAERLSKGCHQSQCETGGKEKSWRGKCRFAVGGGASRMQWSRFPVGGDSVQEQRRWDFLESFSDLEKHLNSLFKLIEKGMIV